MRQWATRKKIKISLPKHNYQLHNNLLKVEWAQGLDPDCFDADLEQDPDPAQNLHADPDPDPDGGGGLQPKMGIPPRKTLGTPLPVTFINININTVPQPDPNPKTNPDAVGQKIKLRDILYNTSVLAQSELNFKSYTSIIRVSWPNNQEKFHSWSQYGPWINLQFNARISWQNPDLI